MLKQAMDPETANATFCAVGEKKNCSSRGVSLISWPKRNILRIFICHMKYV